MTLTDEQLRQVRVWAIETTLGKFSISAGEKPVLYDVLTEASKMVEFVTADQPAAPRK